MSKKKYSIFDHVLVPKHEILTPEEEKELLKKLGITKDKLPKILKTDPVVQELGAKPGQIIKITRKSPTGGVHIYYRVVK